MKNKKHLLHSLSLLAVGYFMTCCSQDDPGRPRVTISPGDNAQADAQAAFINAQSGTDIYFKAGVYEFTSQLSIDNKKDVRIIGAGREKTILSFKDQTASGEGVLATNCTRLLFQALTIRDTKGDALKAKGCAQITFHNVGTVWSGDPRKENGAYGLYPVQCTEVLIDGCYAHGASDSGIYVGQSTNVVVRNSVADGNVSGIEIENTICADIYGNEVFDNAGGILVFDLPGLTQYGSKCRIFNNSCHDNNRTNFAPIGNIVSNVPSGTGVMLLSTRQVEVFDNKLVDNMFANVIMASHLMIGQSSDPNYNPFYSDIYAHDNSYEMKAVFNPQQTPVAAFITFFLNKYGYEQPDIMIDNLLSGAVCISEAQGTTFANLHGESINFETGEGNPDANLVTFTCQGAKVDAIHFDAYGIAL